METSRDRAGLEEAVCEEIRTRVFSDGFMKIVQTVRRGGQTFKISMRPVLISGEKKYQAEMTEGGQVQVKNFDRAGAAKGLEEMIGQKGAREMHLICTDGDMHIRVTRKGHAMVSRSAAMERKAVLQAHDRVKKLPLTSFDSAALLRVTGLAAADGEIRASMRGKYDQVNEFLKVVATLPLAEFNEERKESPRPFTVVDCGCGKAYLTLALYFWLTRVAGLGNVKVIGVDRRADVIASAKDMAARLDVADRVEFVEGDIASFGTQTRQGDVEAFRADLVVSLHACDTATDEALAKAVEWKARFILSAPCCQHELQKSMSEISSRQTGPAASFGGLLRQSILRERLCDILTDSFRAMILRILGFKTQVMEFVSSEATARNIMIKADFSVKPGQSGPVGEYLALRDYWGVKPWLETRLENMLSKYFSRFE